LIISMLKLLLFADMAKDSFLFLLTVNYSG
jgi:hypothetical protein